MEKIFKHLKASIEGEVRWDPLVKQAYSVDASIYEVEPLAVVLPKSLEDLITTLKIADEENIPVIPRGAATGITGGCLGNGLILDLSKYLNTILEINYEREYVICEPGVVQDRLNEELCSRGYRLGPDTSTGNRATIGGMLANNAAGARSLHYGTMVDHVEAVELLLTGGHILHCSAIQEDAWKELCLKNTIEGNIYREILRIRKEYQQDIAKHFPDIPRRVSGYNLNQLLKPAPFNLSTLIVGSEGTLGIANKIKLKIVKKPKATGLCVIHLADMIEGMDAVPYMLSFDPLSLEMIDDQIIASARFSPSVHNKLKWLSGNPQAVFVAEFEAETQQEVQNKLRAFAASMKNKKIGYDYILLEDPKAMEHVWEVRKAGLGLLLSKRTYNRAIAFIEDLSIPPHKLGIFMKQFREYLSSVNKKAGIYGHVGSGCMHIRPYIDLRKANELELMIKIMRDIANLVLEVGGALSGEHGDGLIRSWLNKKMFGDRIYQAFTELKRAFDPRHLMNPGKIVEPSSPTENLRLSPSTEIKAIPTFLDFGAEGGIELAADMCNGNGLCRKAEKLMCPSFQASNDEYDTTRARAQSLRAVIHGKLPIETISEGKILEVLDLCLECKGCKTECPSQVDMAKMKSEMLYQYYQHHSLPLRTRIFGHIGRINQLMSPLAFLFNSMMQSGMSKFFMEKLGIATERPFPQLARQRFSAWLKQQKPNQKEKQVVLFNDTFTEFNFPEIGKAAHFILEKLGYQVIVSSWQCCGRPLISKGMLKQARKKSIALLDSFYLYAQQGIPIVGLEPSCLFTIKDDFASLVGIEERKKAKSIAKMCLTLEEFLLSHLQNGELPFSFIEQERHILFHGHCHQKALIGSKATYEVLSGVKGFKVKEIQSGCCGLAGSFGYEKEHYPFSMKIGELHLLPTIRNSEPNTWIVANGTSCRSQITHGTGRHAYHLAEAIALQIQP